MIFPTDILTAKKHKRSLNRRKYITAGTP